MTDAEEAQWMEERNRSLAKLKEKKSFRRGGEGYCGPDSRACEREDLKTQAAERETRTVSPSSTNTFVADDEIGVSKILEIGQLPKSVLGGVLQKEDSDACWHAEDYSPMHPTNIFPGITEVAGPTSPISSNSDSDSCWDYYFEQSPQTDEV